MQDWYRRQNAPITLGIAVALGIASLVFFFSNGQGMSLLVADVEWLRKPWSLLTYPLAYVGVGDIGKLLFTALMLAWMIFALGSLEREIGGAKYVGLWVLFTAIPALLLLTTMQQVRSGFSLAGPYLPIAALSVAWATRNRFARLMLWGILPLSGAVLGWLIVAGTFFQFGAGAPLLGLVACLPLALAWALASERVPGFRWRSLEVEQVERRDEAKELAFRAEVVQREREREERERLRRLFERSGIDDR